MSLWDAGMFKSSYVHEHTQALHDGARSSVRWRRERYDFGQLEDPKANIQGTSGGLGRKPMTPVCSRQSPQHLDTWRYGQLILWVLEPYTTDEFAGRFDFTGPWTPAMLGD